MLLGHLDEKARARFSKKVDASGGPDACHPWTGAISGEYGRINVAGKARGAHVVAWTIHHGKDVPDGHVIHHACYEKLCCNPIHLQAVTQGENMSAPDGANGTPEGVVALEAEWSLLHRERYGHAATGDVNVFKTLIYKLGEYQARAILRAIVEDWQRFAPFAAHSYGLWYGDADRAPERPTLAIFKGASGTDAINAALAFEHEKAEERRAADPAEQERRRERAFRECFAQMETREAEKAAQAAQAAQAAKAREEAQKKREEADKALAKHRQEEEKRLPWLRDLREKRREKWFGVATPTVASGTEGPEGPGKVTRYSGSGRRGE
jgi:hypothetical protein